jgi:F-type H+-transporting ATPase subunit gamma
MPNTREVRLRIRSVKNIAQVTRALQAVSASKVRKAVAAVFNTRPYATKAWQVLKHVAGQPGRDSLHPLLTKRPEERSILVIMITSDRGLAGAYNANILRLVFNRFKSESANVRYVAIGRKGRDLLIRRHLNVIAEFSNLPPAPSFMDVSPIGRIAVEEFLLGRADAVYLAYTDFITMARQDPIIRKLLPLEVQDTSEHVEEFSAMPSGVSSAAYIYEPDQASILDEIIPRFTALQVYQAILESLASEHAARMVAMQNATDSATALAGALQLEYNKVRQQSITNEILDIVGGANALSEG